MTKERNEQHRTNEIGKELHQTNGKKSSTEQMERMSGSELIKRQATQEQWKNEQHRTNKKINSTEL